MDNVIELDSIRKSTKQYRIYKLLATSFGYALSGWMPDHVVISLIRTLGADGIKMLRNHDLTYKGQLKTYRIPKTPYFSYSGISPTNLLWSEIKPDTLYSYSLVSEHGIAKNARLKRASEQVKLDLYHNILNYAMQQEGFRAALNSTQLKALSAGQEDIR